VLTLKGILLFVNPTVSLYSTVLVLYNTTLYDTPNIGENVLYGCDDPSKKKRRKKKNVRKTPSNIFPAKRLCRNKKCNREKEKK